MAVTYYKNEDETSLEGATKIKTIFLDNQGTYNPYVPYRAVPQEMEELKYGGQKYRFLMANGMPKAGRQGALPTQSGVTYVAPAKFGSKSLEITLPIQMPAEDGKVFVFRNYDDKLTDGTGYSAYASAGIVKGLLVAERDEDLSKLRAAETANEIRKVTINETTPLGVLRGIKNSLTPYFDVSTKNNAWKDPSVDPSETDPNKTHPATKYFHQNQTQYSKDVMAIHLHPTDIMSLSDVNTIAAAGSIPQFTQFQDGTLVAIGGVKVISDPFINIGEYWIFIPNLFGVPDQEMMETNIFDESLPFQKSFGMRAEHYYNMVILTPELITKGDISKLAGVTITTQVPSGANTITRQEGEIVVVEEVVEEKVNSKEKLIEQIKLLGKEIKAEKDEDKKAELVENMKTLQEGLDELK